MWSFRGKRAGQRGSKAGHREDSAPILTDAEKKSVEAEFQFFQDYEVHKQLAEQFRSLVTARGLARYANRQIVISGASSGAVQQREPLEKAIAAISKAYSNYRLPIYLYDMATFVELTGNFDAARQLYEAFLEEQASYVPDQMESAFLRERDLDEAIRDARARMELCSTGQYSQTTAVSAYRRTVCERCGNELQPWASACEKCGWDQGAGKTVTATLQLADMQAEHTDKITRRPIDTGNTRFLLAIVSVVVFGVIAVLAVVGLTRNGERSDNVRASERLMSNLRARRTANKSIAMNRTGEDQGDYSDAEKAHGAILDGAAILHRSLVRDDPDDSAYKKMVQVALEEMTRAVTAQREVEDRGKQPSRGIAYRAWLDCVEAEIIAFRERYQRDDIGRGQAARQAALAPLQAAVSGYDAAYRGALEMPAPSKLEAGGPQGESEDQGKYPSDAEPSSEGADHETAPASDQTNTSEIDNKPAEGQTEATPPSNSPASPPG